MPKKTLESLGALIKARRGEESLREVAKKVGIGSATLMRIQNGHTPDIHTFAKICLWLNIDPGEFLGFKQGAHSAQPAPTTICAHFRAERTLPPATAMALAKMITMAAGMQPEKTGSQDA